MTLRKFLYHSTRREYLKSILEEGIIPRKPKNIAGGKVGVYLSERPFDWMHYVTDNTTVAGAMIEVNVRGLKLKTDNGIDGADLKKHPAYFYEGVIPPERFKSIIVSTDDNPACFKEYDFRRD